MFTGIVKGVRPVEAVINREGSRRLSVALGDWSEQLELGASVAINGTCLTVVHSQNGRVEFDVILETLKRTNLGQLQRGDQVNIERACRYGEEVGGHHVTGHVDTVATLQTIQHSPNNCTVTIHHAPEWRKYLVPQGWIAVDGISLTVVSVASDSFTVSLIPETLSRTTLGFKKVGESVNLEFDHTTKVLVLTLERLLPSLLERLTPPSSRS